MLGVGAQGIHVASLAFSVDGVESQGRLAAARKAGHDHEFPSGDVYGNVLEIVGLSPSYGDIFSFAHFLGSLRSGWDRICGPWRQYDKNNAFVRKDKGLEMSTVWELAVFASEIFDAPIESVFCRQSRRALEVDSTEWTEMNKYELIFGGIKRIKLYIFADSVTVYETRDPRTCISSFKSGRSIWPKTVDFI